MIATRLTTTTRFVEGGGYSISPHPPGELYPTSPLREIINRPTADSPKREYSSDTVHVSELIRRIAIRNNVIGDPGLDDLLQSNTLDAEARRLRMMLGIAWENYLGRARRDWWKSNGYDYECWPGPRKLDSIIGSVDGIICASTRPGTEQAVDEIKTTRKGPQDIVRYWMYTTQVKAYCKLWQLRRAELSVLHLGAHNLSVSAFALEFTQREIDDVWVMLVKERDVVMVERKAAVEAGEEMATR